MKLKCLSCEALARPVYLAAAYSPHTVDVEIFRIGLHNTPKKLRETLQERIDALADESYEALVLAYGLCGQATADLEAKGMPLVIPKAHDCITLFLGSRDRYNKEFEATPGTYWYTADYIERKDKGTTLGFGGGLSDDNQSLYEEYVEKYGEDNAEYLMEVMGAWKQHYERAAYIDLGVGDSGVVETQAREEADRRGWSFARISGDLVLVRRLLNADWDDDFLKLEPGQKIAMASGDEVVRCLDPQKI